jgi:hypothetical protein
LADAGFFIDFWNEEAKPQPGQMERKQEYFCGDHHPALRAA